MGVKIDRVRFAANTVNGTQTITFSLGGLTPKAVWFVWGLPTADNTASDGLVVGSGMTDGTVQGMIAHYEQHAQASANSNILYSGAQCIRLINDAGTTLQTAAFTSFAANQVTITWTVTTGTAVLIEAIAFAGSDLSAKVTDTTLTNTLGATDDVTNPGFEPDDVITLGGGSIGISFGFVHNDRAGGVTQRTAISAERNGRPTMEDTAKVSDAHGAFSGSTGATDLMSWLSFSAFDSSGFSVTSANQAPGSSRHLLTLSLRYGTVPVISSKVYTYSTPTATGNSTDVNPDFLPQAVIYIPTLLEAVNTLDTSTLAGSWGVSTIVSGGQGCVTWSSEDAAADSNTQTLTDDQAVNLPLHTGAAGMAATFVGFTSQGVTLNWSDIETNAKKWIAIAFGEMSSRLITNIGAEVEYKDTRADRITNIGANVEYKSLREDRITNIGVNIEYILSTGKTAFLSSTINISDTISNARNIRRTKSETVQISDALSKVLNKVKSIANSVNVSDVLSKARGISKSISNTVQISDAISSIKIIAKLIQNTIESSDTISRVIGRYKTLSNTVNIEDTLIKARSIIRSLADSINISDTITNTRSLFRTLTDTEQIADTLSKSIGRLKTISNSINISDTISAIKLLVRTITNSVQVSDTLNKSIGRYKTLVDSIEISDIISKARNIIRSLSDTVNSSDVIINARGIIRSISNTINISDVISAIKPGLDKFVTLVSTIEVSDVISRSRGVFKNIADSINISDNISNIRNILRTFSNSIQASDTVTKSRNIVRNIAENISVTSVIIRVGTFIRSISNNINITDSLNFVKLKEVLISNVIQVTSSISTLVQEVVNIAVEKFKIYLDGSKDLISRLSGSFKRRKTLLGSKDKDKHFRG